MDCAPSLVVTVKDPSLLAGQGFQLIYEFWLKSKGDRELPPARAIAPHAIPKPLLGDCSIMSVEDGKKRFHIRLMGTRVVQALGFDLTNCWGDDQPNAAEVIAACMNCVDSRLPLYSEISTAWAGHDFKRSKSLMLPYAGPDNSVRRILSYVQFCYPAKSAPCDLRPV